MKPAPMSRWGWVASSGSWLAQDASHSTRFWLDVSRNVTGRGWRRERKAFHAAGRDLPCPGHRSRSNLLLTCDTPFYST
jgi:hypothetical protein